MSHLANAAFSLWMQIETATNYDGWSEDSDYSFQSYAMMKNALLNLEACFTDVDAQIYRNHQANHLMTLRTLTTWQYQFVIQELAEVENGFFFDKFTQTYLNLYLETKAQIANDEAQLRMEQGI